MADPWKIGAMAWSLTVLSWLLAPVIGFMVNKLFAYLCVDVERKLNELEINTIPTLKLTMMGVQEQMMRIAAKGKGRESDMKILEKMNKDLKSALYAAEDMLDLVAYHRIEKKVIGDTSNWEKHLRDAARAFLAGCKGRPWFGGCADIARDAATRCSEVWNQLLCRLAPDRQSSTYDPEAPGNRPQQTSSAVQAPQQTSSAVQAPEQPSSVVQAPEQTSSAVQAPEQTSSVVQTPEQPSSAVQAAEQTSSAVQASEQTSSAVQAPEQPSSAVNAPGQPSSAVQTSEQPSSAVQVPEQTSSAAQASEQTSSWFLPIYNSCRSIFSWLTDGLDRQSSTYDPEAPGNRLQQTSSAVHVPEQTSSALQAPQQTSSWFLPIYNRPQQTSSAVQAPQQTSSWFLPMYNRPQQTSSVVQAPQQTGSWFLPIYNRPQQTSSAVQATEQPSSAVQAPEQISAWFLPIYKSCRSIFSWLTDVIAVFRSCRDWSYEVVGIKINKKDDGIGLDSFQLTVHRKSLRETMEQIDSIITDLKKSPLLTEQSTSNNLDASVNDIDKESSSNNLLSVEDKHKESTSDQKEIDDMHRSIRQPIFGRQEDQEHISRLLREEPSSSSNSTSYSVIGIHGIKGSGKTTLARCVCEHEEKADGKHFDTIFFIPLSKTFRLQDILCDMLMEITSSDKPKKSIEQDGQSRCKDLESLESLNSELKEKLKGRNVQSLRRELKEKLKGRRFLLVLDDLCVNDENQKQRDILLDTLDAGKSGSGILVTAQTKDAAAALGAQKQISIPELRPEEYLSLFMHHALQGACDGDGKYRTVGIRIVEKLRKSPIAAVAVAKRLQKNKSIGFWEMTANLDVLNETMGALWWSYQQLGSDVRRCFEYCGIFPRGYELERDAVIDMWIAQGFVKTSNATEELEDVGQRYFEELLTFSFLQECSPTFTGYFTIHDLLHELAERVAGGDLFRIGPNGSSQRLIPPEGTSAEKIPPEVRHLFIETYGIEETSAKKIPDLENLRTLIIEEKYRPDEEVCIRGGNIERHRLAMEKLFKVMFRKMRKLRVLKVKVIKRQHNLVLSVPGSIGQMKHLRLLQYCYTGHIMLSQKANIRPPSLKIIFPSTFCKLYHMQILKFTLPDTKVSLPKDTANKLIHLRRIRGALRMPNVGRLASLQSMPWFFVRKIPGCELKQLKHLNNLRGRLDLHGLRNVGSKDETLEANLAGKKRLTELGLDFTRSNPDVAAEVLEGFLPPKDLKKLLLWRFIGSRYASWMLSPQNPDAPMNLDTLFLFDCSQLVSIPEGTQLFARLRSLFISRCTWDAQPEHMERLKLLEELTIFRCDKIELLPTLPQSLL